MRTIESAGQLVAAKNAAELARTRIVVRGVVQGVGFRPFIYRLASEHGLNGWVLNSTEGVIIEVEGTKQKLAEFIDDIPRKAPVRAVIEAVENYFLPPVGYQSFDIQASQEEGDKFVLISPDICVCPDCLKELFHPKDRRYHYPFTNCTNCGPRFTIIKDIPYDQPKTTMVSFPMCPDCHEEYDDPLDRRFHAQPNACPVCGPQVNQRKVKDGIVRDYTSQLTGHDIYIYFCSCDDPGAQPVWVPEWVIPSLPQRL